MSTHFETVRTSTPWAARLIELLRHAAVAPAEQLEEQAHAVGDLLARLGISVADINHCYTETLIELANAIVPGDTDTASQTAATMAHVWKAYQEYDRQPPPSAQSRLDEITAFYCQLCEADPAPVFMVDMEGRCLCANRPAQRLFQQSSAECGGTGWLSWVEPTERERTLAAMRRAHATGGRFEREIARRDPHGDETWWLVRSEPLPDEAVRYRWRLVTVDTITERKRAQRALEESEAKFRVLAETVPIGILIYRDQRYLYLNPMMEVITGYSRDEMLAMPFLNIVHPDMRAEVRDRANARQAGESVPVRYEIKVLTKAGDDRWVDYTAALINYQGRPAVLGAVMDITDRKLAEDEARRRHAELIHVARVSTLGNMATQLAHELNQPLAAIVNYASGCERRLAAGTAAGPEIRDAIGEMRGQAERAGEIIKRIRRFVRKQPNKTIDVDINRIVSDAVTLAAAANPWRIPIELQLADNLPAVQVDEIQIMQVIVNLVRNALEAMSATSPNGRLMIATAAAGDGVHVTVRDTGPGLVGIEPNQLFEPFVTTKQDGLGIGLSICRSIVELHGGVLSATHNGLETGLTVEFTLPATS